MENFPLHVGHVRQLQAAINRVHTLIHFTLLLALLYYRASVLLFDSSKSNLATPVPMLAWALISASELQLSFLWLLRQAYRWRPVSRTVFSGRLPPDDKLPAIDVFICIADPKKEPTVEVMDTVVSAMSLEYPPEKLTVYLSDDAGSPLTLYAIREASSFARSWLPFCSKHGIETRFPGAYFSASAHEKESLLLRSKEFIEEREAIKVIQNEVSDAVGQEQANKMPLLVYVSREKRQNYHHNFKAGALNVLLRVSGIISNAPCILVLDCDMYCNDPTSAKQAMCFYLDPRSSKRLAFVQFPQIFHNISNNDIYDSQLRSIFTTRWRGADGLQGPILSGTGFYIRREALYGTSRQKTDNDLLQLRKCFGPPNLFIASLKQNYKRNFVNGDASVESPQEAQLLASCSYERNTEWGEKASSATVSLNDNMVQNIRWGCGLLEVGLSRFCPLIYGSSRMSILQSMCYAFLAFRSLYSLPILCYATIPQLCLFNGISLYPKVSSPWFAIFAIVYVSILSQHLSEVLFEAGSLRMWWNELRIWMIKSVTAYFFACLDVLMKLIGLKKANFIVTSKVVDEAQVERYKMGVFSFEGDPFFLVILVTLVTLNMVSFTAGLGRMISTNKYDDIFGHVFLSFFILRISYPIIEGMILRRDNGRVPVSVTLISVAISMVILSLGCILLMY
uniref:Cellulose synthase-like protein G2 n=1 Tax=Nelumbo nucifera TaxID=4432 RepID=A0A822XLJ8_NELNU|nr:TPA_asm: hypothetical protein HUJ06_021279 [Nelumbo nucifera]